MHGKIIKEVHDCNFLMPDIDNYPDGTQWQCECKQVYVAAGVEGVGFRHPSPFRRDWLTSEQLNYYTKKKRISDSSLHKIADLIIADLIGD